MGELDLIIAQQATDFPRKTTARLIGRALHEEHHVRLCHESAEALFELLWRLHFLHSWGRRGEFV
jgi:hypothetical protein